MKKSVKVKAISVVLSLALLLSLVTAVSLMTQAEEVEVVKSGETKMFWPTTDGYKFGDGTIFLSGSKIQASSGGLAMHVYIDNKLVYESPNSSSYTFEQDCQSNSEVTYYSPYVPGSNGESGCVIYFDSYTDPTKKAYINVDNATSTSDSIYIEGVAGQEYIIVPKGTPITDSDWKNSIKPDPERDNWVFFENLKAATEFEIYTRTAETDTANAGTAEKANVHTSLSCISLEYDSTLVGATVKVIPEPETEGLTYKWYQDVATGDGEGAIQHELTEITGAAGDTYTFREEDIGKGITVKIFAGNSEVGEVEIEGPVTLTATVNFDSMGGSEVEAITDVGYRSKIKEPKEPVRKGYVFDGWFYEEEYITPFDFEKDVITWDDTTLYAKWEPFSYDITAISGLSGKGNKQWTKGAKASVAITVENNGQDNSFDHLLGVKLDGKDLVLDKDYTVDKDSSKIILKPETLEKLSLGNHTVTVLFDDGEVETTLTITEQKAETASPKTGNSGEITFLVILMELSLLALAGTMITRRKKNLDK